MRKREVEAQDGEAELARRSTRHWLLGLTLGTLMLVAAAVIAPPVRRRHHRPGQHHFSSLALVGALTSIVLITGAGTVLVWWLLTRPEYQRVMGFTWRRRMRVSKALRRGDPISPDDMAVADALVVAMRRQKFIFWFQPVLIASWTVMAFARHGIGRWLYAGYALALGPAWLYFIRAQRRSFRYWDALSHRANADPQDIGSAANPHDTDE